MLLRNAVGQQAAGRAITMIHNNYFNDAFFLKTLASNGVSPTWGGQHDTKPAKSDAKPFGVNYPGATFKFTILDTSGKKRANQVAQYPVSTYLGLSLPYSLFGLGRTNNYVEELFVGVTRNQPEHFTTYMGVIPNSQLIIIPYQSEDESRTPDSGSIGGGPGEGGTGTGAGENVSVTAENRGGPSEWLLELYIRPGDYVPWVFVVLAGSIVLLSGVVVGLNVKERVRGKRRKEEEELGLEPFLWNGFVCFFAIVF
jgi:integrin alpha FG-GAP repeat containing protein 1